MSIEGEARAAGDPRPRRRQPRVALVETVRLIILVLSTAAGWGVAEIFDLTDERAPSRSIALALGALTGYVLGGVFGRSTVTAMNTIERRFQKASAADILAGTVGLILGLVMASLLSFPLLLLPLEPAFAYPAVGFVYLMLGSIGYRVGTSKRDDFFGLLGLKPRAAGGQAELAVIDTSALIDGRIVDVVRAGFLGGTLLVADGVLAELRTIGDSSDRLRRERGRRGLDAIERLQRDPEVDVILIDGVPELAGDDVDAALVRLARERRAALVTNDTQLSKVAEAVGVSVRSVARLSQALKPAVGPGDELEITLTQPGKEAGQGVGHLDDGTMVVVQDASARIGSPVRVRVRNVINTANGRIIFAELPPEEGG